MYSNFSSVFAIKTIVMTQRLHDARIILHKLFCCLVIVHGLLLLELRQEEDWVFFLATPRNNRRLYKNSPRSPCLMLPLRALNDKNRNDIWGRRVNDIH